jgi:hypothetical protein
MAQYMLMCYQPEVDPAEQDEDAAGMSMLLELHRSLREAGVLLDVQRLRPVDSATSVRVRDGQTQITDGPFAVTKEMLAGYYLVECADLDEVAAGLSGARSGTIEVRPIIPLAEWADPAPDIPDEAVEDPA